MVKLKFRQKSRAKRRGKNLPGRLRIAARRGVTLVELMISMLILALVCIAWLEIIGIQSARKEARRREAVERLSGMMDAFLYCNTQQVGSANQSVAYSMSIDGNNNLRFYSYGNGNTNAVFRMFEGDVSPIGYQLCLVPAASLPEGWKSAADWGTSRWLIGRLYNQYGTVAEAGRPFFTLPVCLGF